MKFNEVICAPAVSAGHGAAIFSALQGVGEADNLFVATNKQEFLTALHTNFTAYIITEDPTKAVEKIAMPEAVKGQLALAIVAESRFLYGSKVAEKITDSLHEQAYINAEKAKNIRLILQESLTNAIEHGNLGLSSEEHKSLDNHSWFDDYYKKVNDKLENTPAGKKLVSIFIVADKDCLHLWVEDEGEGFDAKKAHSNLDVENPYGKGLSLAASLSCGLNHDKNGTRAKFVICTKNNKPAFSSPTRDSVKEEGRILVVDDQKMNRDLISHFLKYGGYNNIETATDGKDALSKIAAQKPDLILMDVVMPEMDGFEACEAIKANPDTADIPILFLSGLSDAKYRTKGYQLGAVDYVAKPIDKNEILARTKVHIMNGMMFNSMQAFSNRLMEDLNEARDFQIDLLPSASKITEISQNYPVEIQADYIPCDELAGDYWSLFESKNNSLGFTMVDFTGHGVKAALNTIRLHAIFYELESLWNQPEALTRNMNSRMCKMLKIGNFATFIYGVINTENGNVTMTCCGAPPVALIPENGKIELIDSSGVPVGLVDDPDSELNVQRFTMQPNATLFLYSDALVETTHKNGKIWMDNNNAELITSLESSRDIKGSILKNTLQKFNKTANKPLNDDLTLLTIKYSP